MKNKQEILKALKTIQKICRENRCCTCPFEKNDSCIIQDQNPEDWKIRETDIWKAFEDFKD